MKELGEVVPGADSAPKPVSNNPTTAGTAVPPPASLVSILDLFTRCRTMCNQCFDHNNCVKITLIISFSFV